MRIQHNIMAMNAYRNYTNNVSAMKKNLEKLSSGYKINRAGDDAAGLAISEKMRAQITGLQTAQKNAKDGISLVQTAEGALTEVHDMLNRMVELATQSANGTYDNDTDRYQLQKEMDQLKDEIDRIADSANFNGIKLLDGSMDGSEGKEVITDIPAETTVLDASFLPVKGGVLGTNTVLHQNANKGTGGTTFSVDLHNTVFGNNAANDDTGAEADKLTLTVGDQTWELTGTGNGELAGEDLVNAIVEEINKNADADGNVIIDGFKGQKFKVTAGTGGDNRITFQQVNAPSGDDQVVDGDMKVSITGNIGSGTASAGTPAVKAKYTIDLSNATNTTILDKAGIAHAHDNTDATAFEDMTDAQVAAVATAIDGVQVIFEGNIDKTMQKFVEDYNSWKDDATGNTKDYTASWDGKVLTLEAKVAGAVDNANAGNGTEAPAAAPQFTNAGNLTQNQEAVKAVYTLDLSGLPAADAQANMAAKLIDNVAVEWDTDMDTTMSKFVDKYNADTTKDYTAEWADGKLTMTAKNAGAIAGTGPASAPSTSITYTPATKATYTITVADPSTSTIAENDTITINGVGYTVKDAATGGGDITTEDAKDKAKLTEFIASKLASNDYDITVDADAGTITYTAKEAGDGKTQPPFAFDTTLATTTTDLNVTGNFVDGTDVLHNNPATFANPTAGVDAGVTTGATADFTEDTVGAAANGDGVVVIGTPDYNFKTTAITNVGAEAGGRLASTYFDLTEEMVVDGGSLTIGKQTYTFSSDAADDGVEGKVYIGDLVDAEGNVDIAGNLDEIAQRVTDAAKNNTTWTVGHDKGGSTLSFVEKQGQTEYVGEDGKTSTLTSVDNIAATFSWTGVSSSTTTVEGVGGVNGDGNGRALTLQIGDTAEEFNQLTIDIKDMHAAALGLGEDVKISDQESAAAAVDAIKAAINKVSDVRGTLGATQNRLDHTINNLSVMTENIQDAESTIRDTDVADEMMAYTKNNILIQSAQAMLAQANQVPQGVLQLLQ